LYLISELFVRKTDRKIGATSCQILRLKCIKFDFRWGCPEFNLRDRERGEKGKGEGRGNDLTHPCHKFLATPLDQEVASLTTGRVLPGKYTWMGD